jgi:hypothetical protein
LLLLSIVLFAAWIAGPAGAQALSSYAFERHVPVSLAQDEPWSWFGLPQGAQQVWGVAFEMPAAQGADVFAAASPVALRQPAPIVYALISPVVESHLASVDFERADGERVSVRAEECALAWAASEPHTRRLLLARGEGAIARIVPHGCYLFAILTGDGDAAVDAELKAQYERGQAEWRERFAREAPAVIRLQETAAAIPSGRIAVLPPTGAEPAALAMVLGRTGLRQKLVELEGADLLDAETFNAQRLPVALYVGQEAHLRTIRSENDAADAVIRYANEGGAIVMATAWPYPTYYALDAGAPQGIPNQPLLRRMGIDIVAAFERPPEGAKLSLCPVAGQTALPSLQEPWPFPDTGDLRLRSFGSKSETVTMTPLVEVRAEDGTPIGPAAALFGFPKGGAILYVWSGIMNDARVADGVACDIVRWIAGKLEGVSDAD